MRRRFTVLLTALTIGMVLAVAPAGTAQAVACTWENCTGKDPQAAGCSPSGRTVKEFTSVGVRIELRYSSTCHAAWVRATNPDACCDNHESQIRGYGTKATLLRMYRKQFPWDGSNWTPMIGASSGMRAFRACEAYLQTGDGLTCTALWSPF
jgi:hypothetical protein